MTTKELDALAHQVLTEMRVQQATIRKQPNGKWKLLSHDGKNLGEFDSKEAAEKHEREVQAFKHMTDWPDESSAPTDEGKAAENAREPEDHMKAAAYHAAEAKKEQAAGNTGRANAHTRAVAAHVHAANTKSPRASTAANLASDEAHRTGGKFGPRQKAEYDTVEDLDTESWMRWHEANDAKSLSDAHGRMAAQHSSRAAVEAKRGNSDAAEAHAFAAEAHKAAAAGGANRAATDHALGATARANRVSARGQKLEVRQELYSDDQERDEHGRWSSESGSDWKRGELERHADDPGAKVRIVGKIKGAGTIGTLHSAKGDFAGVRNEKGEHVGYYHSSNLKKHEEGGDEEESASYQDQFLDATPVTLDSKLMADEELPEALRGKGLVRGKPFEYFRLGISHAKDGRVFVVDDRAVASMLAHGNGAEQPIPFDFSHRKDPEHGADQSGYLFHFSVDPRSLWVDRAAWTRTAGEKIADGSRGFISPEVSCEPLDPETLETLDETSPLYDPTLNDGRGGYRTNTWRPMIPLGGGLVPNPALPNLPPVTLSTDKPADQAERKENEMKPEMLKFLGLPATATPAQVKQALAAKLPKRGAYAQLLADGEAGGGGGGLDRKAILDQFRKLNKIPDVIDDEMLCDLICDKLQGEEPEPAEPPKLPAVTETMPPAETMATAVKLATKQIRQELADAEEAARAAGFDAELLAAEKDGKIVAAARPFWQAKFKADSALARQELAAVAAPAKVPSAEIVGGEQDPSISVDHLPAEERDQILSRAAAYAVHKGLHPRQFAVALAAVRGGDVEERSYHAAVLASDPDWGKPVVGRTGRGRKWRQQLNASGMRLHKDFDPDKVAFIFRQMKDGKIPDNVVPSDLQKQALEAFQRQTLGGEASYFQPPSRFPVPGMGFGYFQGEYGGSEIAPEFQAGVNLEAYYPIYGKEALRVVVNSVTGLPNPIGRHSEAKPSMTRGYDFKKVTLEGYGNTQWVDRMDQAAGDAVLPIGVMAQATQDALTYGKNEKELIQASKLRDTSQYYPGAGAVPAFYKDLSGGGQWSDPATKVIQMFKGARVQIWRQTGAMPEVSLMGVDVVETLSYHPQILTAAQTAGLGHLDKPMAYAPPEMLVALFGTIVTPTCRIATTADGSGADTPWGQDVILAVISRGEIVAPRAFVTCVSPGYPITQGVAVNVGKGLRGSDGIDYADVYAVETAGASGATTQSAFLFQNVCPALTAA